MATGTQAIGPVPFQPLADAQRRRSRTLVQARIDVGRRRWWVRAQDIVQQPLAPQHGRRAVRVRGDRHQPSVPEQTPALLGVRKRDPPRAAAVHTRDPVKPRQAFVHVRVVRAQQLHDRTIVAQSTGDEHLCLLLERFQETLIEIRILERIGELLREEAQVQPLSRKALYERVDGARIRQHPSHLFFENGGLRQAPVFR